MKNRLIAVIICLVSCGFSFSQNVTIETNYDKKYNSVSTSLIGGRYEILQSDLVAKYTFKIDKYKGNIYQLT